MKNEYTIDDATNFVLENFVNKSTARYDRLKSINFSEQIIPGTLFRFEMEHENLGAVTIQIYHGLGDLGGRLWEQLSRRAPMLGRALPAHPR